MTATQSPSGEWYRRAGTASLDPGTVAQKTTSEVYTRMLKLLLIPHLEIGSHTDSAHKYSPSIFASRETWAPCHHKQGKWALPQQLLKPREQTRHEQNTRCNDTIQGHPWTTLNHLSSNGDKLFNGENSIDAMLGDR